VQAHADPGPIGGHVAAEDLADADLGRPLGLVLVADHPQGHHAAGVVDRPGPQLEQAVLGDEQPGVVLGLANHQAVREARLADRAADRAGEHPVWSDDTRVWPSNSGHQGGWSASMTSRRVPSPSRYLAAEASRGLHWGSQRARSRVSPSKVSSKTSA
jgi:hypothetical protein